MHLRNLAPPICKASLSNPPSCDIQVNRLLLKWLSSPSPLANAMHSLRARSSHAREGSKGMEQEVADTTFQLLVSLPDRLANRLQGKVPCALLPSAYFPLLAQHSLQAAEDQAGGPGALLGRMCQGGHADVVARALLDRVPAQAGGSGMVLWRAGRRGAGCAPGERDFVGQALQACGGGGGGLVSSVVSKVPLFHARADTHTHSSSRERSFGEVHLFRTWVALEMDSKQYRHRVA